MDHIGKGIDATMVGVGTMIMIEGVIEIAQISIATARILIEIGTKIAKMIEKIRLKKVRLQRPTVEAAKKNNENNKICSFLNHWGKIMQKIATKSGGKKLGKKN